MTALDQLCAACGVVWRYRDVTGTERIAPPETRRALLAALGFAAYDEAQAMESLKRLKAEAAARLAPPVFIAQGAPIALDPRVERWRLELEDGAWLEGNTRALPMGLPIGRHALTLKGAGRKDEAFVLAAPQGGAPALKALTDREKLWGATAALYGLRSGRNGGVGDFEDLARLAASLAHQGAAFLGINPVHALGWGGETAAYAPYSPSSRRFLNVAHVALDLFPEWAALPETLTQRPDNSGDVIDYDAARAWRAPIMEAIYAAFMESAFPERRESFAAWRAEHGESLERQALYQAISEAHGPSWPAWPKNLQKPNGAGVKAFKARAEFHAFWLWIADIQIKAAQAKAKAAGMALGLYQDLAVGARPDGAETWAEPEMFLKGCSLGAPPDALGPNGQRWDLAPFNPLALRASGYRSLIETLRAAMGAAGALRIDHVIGYARSFILPDGLPGAYVAQNFEELMAVVAIEAHRAGCLVVGEDLGVLPEGMGQKLKDAGLLGYRLMLFERDSHQTGGGFHPPQAYQPEALAAFSTHDAPTVAGWRRARDIDWRERIGDTTPALAAEARDKRAHERWRFAEILAWIGALPHERIPEFAAAERNDAEIIRAAHEFLAQTPCALAAVQLEDILGQVDQANLPGDIDKHPNWRRRYAASVDEIKTAPGLLAAAAAMARAGRS